MVRLPITDEHEPEEKDFDELKTFLELADPSWSVVCNCQMGRGRTTTAMVLLSLLWPMIGQGSVGPSSSGPDAAAGDDEVPLAEELVARLRNHQGPKARRWADECIRRCNHMQDLRGAMVKKLPMLHRNSVKPRDAMIAAHYLERYLFLILVASYLLEQKGQPLAEVIVTFRSWMKSVQHEIDIYDLVDKVHHMRPT